MDRFRAPSNGLAPSREQARLVRAARGGDARALRRLLDEVSGPVYRFGRGFCRDPHDAEDVMQDVLIALARSLSTFRGESSLTTWAYVVARRACMRHRRRNPGSLEALDAEGPARAAARAVPDTEADPQRRFERREILALVERATDRLPAAQREVVLMRDVEGMSAREVARALGLGERAVKSRLHRARATLRSALSSVLGRAPGGRGPAGGPPGPVGPDSSDAGSRCADTVRLISRYLEGELTSDVCARLSAHVDACDECGEACRTLRATLGACRDWGRADVPRDARDRIREAVRRVAARVTGTQSLARPAPSRSRVVPLGSAE